MKFFKLMPRSFRVTTLPIIYKIYIYIERFGSFLTDCCFPLEKCE